MASAASGSGAAAASKLNDEKGGSPDKVPKAPDGPPTGRPQPGKDSGDSAEEDMWRGLLQGVGTDISSKHFQRCVKLAAQLQRCSLELAEAGRSASISEADLRRLVRENLFKPCPNPQDGERVTSVASEKPTSPRTATVKLEGEDAETGHPSELKGADKFQSHDSWRDEALTERSRRGTQNLGQKMFHRKSLAGLSPEALARRKSLHLQGSQASVFKHMNGCPSVVYDYGAQVGEGTFGTVRKARHKQTGQIHAIKSVPKCKVISEDLWNEIDIMKQMDHPHIMRLYYTFEDDTHIYMASEMCAGGELFDTMNEAGFLTERTCCSLFAQILGAVNYLHCKSICHRDLKPENFLVLKKIEYHLIQLKLVDFGTATRFDTGPMLTKVCTAHYVAPEVLKRGDVPYSEKVDIWSCGVILYMMLCGFMPFHNEDNLELLKLVKKGKYQFNPDRVWKLISDDAKALVRHMMCVKPDQRFNALECVQHQWMTNSDKSVSSVDEQIVRQMRKFLTNNRLKRVALQIIARQIRDETVERLRNIFLGIDEDYSGCLTLEEMTEALKSLDLSEASQQEMQQILVCVDQDQSGTIEWTEFLAATLTKEQYLQEDACKGAFHLLDVDEDGLLNKADLTSFLAAECDRSENGLCSTTLFEIDAIMKETDENGDGDISFEEFMMLMSDDGPRKDISACALRFRRGKKERASVLHTKDLRTPSEKASAVEQRSSLGKMCSLHTVEGEEEESDEDDFSNEFGEEDYEGSKTFDASSKDEDKDWVMQSQKAWEFVKKKCTLTIYEKRDEGILQFEIQFTESGEHITATGSKTDFEKLCKEKEGRGMSTPVATDAAITEILGGGGS